MLIISFLFFSLLLLSLYVYFLLVAAFHFVIKEKTNNVQVIDSKLLTVVVLFLFLLSYSFIIEGAYGNASKKNQTSEFIEWDEEVFLFFFEFLHTHNEKEKQCLR